MRRLTDGRGRLSEYRARLSGGGLSDDEVKRVMDPLESYYLQLQEEVDNFEAA